MVEHTFEGDKDLSGPLLLPTAGEAAAAVDTFCAYIESLDPRSAVKLTEDVRRRLDAADAKALATGIVGPPAVKSGAKGAYRIAESADVSKNEQRRRVNRARVVAENDKIADKMADGTLCSDHVDAIARAARRTDGAAAHDSDLIDEVAAASPDQAARIADDWVNDHLTASQVQTEHDRQRKLRTARRTTTPDGLASIILSGDKASVDSAWRSIEGVADRLYATDGGRETPHNEHPRSTTQRLFDAAIGLVDDETSAVPGGLPAIILTAGVDTMTGSTDKPAELIGTGPVAETVFERYRCHAELIGIVFGTDGQPLWHGRSIRTATPAQRTALVARDRGCVLCGACHNRCEVHHLVPYNAPAKGETDIDNLALVCGACHRWLHERRYTLIRGPDGTWSTRPACPDEITKRPPQLE